MSATHTPRPTPSRPTTPLRPPSRGSLRGSRSSSAAGFVNPLESLEAGFAEFADGMADLEANMMHLQLMHESLARFSESFASFLYGMNMNAFCVDFPEAPIPESFRRIRASAENSETQLLNHREIPDIEATVMTTDSFVEHPPASSKTSSKYSTPAGPTSKIGRGGAAASRGGRRVPRGRVSGIARGSARGRGRGT